MAKLTLADIAAGYASTTTINNNNALIEAALENTLSRDGTTPNQMSADIDLNSNFVANLGVPTNDAHAATKKYVDDIVTGFTDGSTEFSAALPYTITGAWDFETLTDFLAGIRIQDAGGADEFRGVHDGTDLNFTQVGTTDVNFPALDGLGLYTFQDQVHAWGAVYVFQSADQLSWAYLTVASDVATITGGGNITDLNISNVFANVDVDANLYVRNSHRFRVYDSGDDDHLALTHEDTYALLQTAGTGVGAVPIRLDPGSGNYTRLDNGAFFVPEIAAELADQVGFGQIWVRSSDGALMFSTGAGANFVVDLTAA